MKKALFLLFSIVLLSACEADNEAEAGMYCFGAGNIKYEATIGYDFVSALDSLLKVVPYGQLFNNKPYYIDPELMDRVNYPSNDRYFYMITVKDSVTGQYLASPGNVLDTKGCWYKIIWGED